MVAQAFEKKKKKAKTQKKPLKKHERGSYEESSSSESEDELKKAAPTKAIIFVKKPVKESSITVDYDSSSDEPAAQVEEDISSSEESSDEEKTAKKQAVKKAIKQASNSSDDDSDEEEVSPNEDDESETAKKKMEEEKARHEQLRNEVRFALSYGKAHNWYKLSSVIEQMERDPIDKKSRIIKALHDEISYIETPEHMAIISCAFACNLWNLKPLQMSWVISFVVDLATSSEHNCLDLGMEMLVRNFTPPHRIPDISDYVKSKRAHVLPYVHLALETIMTKISVDPMKLVKIVQKREPNLADDRVSPIIYAEFVSNMLRLQSGDKGEPYVESIITEVMRIVRLLDQAMEKGVHKLDAVMAVIIKHLQLCKETGRIYKVFSVLLGLFEKFLQHKFEKYNPTGYQFVIFYACLLDEKCKLEFESKLFDIFEANSKPQHERENAVRCLASYLSRDTWFVRYNKTMIRLERLVGWLSNYVASEDFDKNNSESTSSRQPFYAGCEAVMQVICFHLEAFMSDPELKERLFALNFEKILSNEELKPLVVCTRCVVNEFLRQVKASQLANRYKDLVDKCICRGFGFGPLDDFEFKRFEGLITGLDTGHNERNVDFLNEDDRL